ncbi:MAG: hypothetical protein ACRCZP_09880, partial [Phycicoccus sp.]
MTTTYFRIQTADRDVADLLQPGRTSCHWNEIDSEEYTRSGVSTCETREDLAAYLADSGIPYGAGEWVIVELAGDVSDDTPYDAQFGEILIHPTEIISVAPMD